MATSTHKKVEISEGDLVVISASPIPGNEKMIYTVINDLFRRARRSTTTIDIHVSGHARQEELKLMHRLTRPKFFMPIHGEYRHSKMHAKLAESMGMPEKNIFIMQNGKVLELTSRSAKVTGAVQSGSVLVDGLGVEMWRDRSSRQEDPF